MITNDRQYEITQRWIGRFKDSLDEVTRLLASDVDDRNERRKLEVFAASFRSEIADLEAQRAEYEALVAGQVRSFQFASLHDLPIALIKARLAAGLSECQLAERLGITEEQLLHHERNDYQTATVADLLEIAAILGVTVRGDLVLSDATRQSAA
jgi:Helix-turn-helix